jgi:hypothetical protein
VSATAIPGNFFETGRFFCRQSKSAPGQYCHSGP